MWLMRLIIRLDAPLRSYLLGGVMSRIREPDPQRENPEQVQLDGVLDGIEALPKRIDRYGKAKKALSMWPIIWLPFPSIKPWRPRFKGAGTT